MPFLSFYDLFLIIYKYLSFKMHYEHYFIYFFIKKVNKDERTGKIETQADNSGVKKIIALFSVHFVSLRAADKSISEAPQTQRLFSLFFQSGTSLHYNDAHDTFYERRRVFCWNISSRLSNQRLTKQIKINN